MQDNFPNRLELRVADLPQRRATAFRVTPDKSARAAISEDLGISGIRKLVFAGNISADGKSDWKLDGKLGATVVQPCVVTLEPVTTRLDLPVLRRFVAGFVTRDSEDDDEMMPEDDTEEALGTEINLMRVLTEALALALPDYPRAENAQLEQANFAGADVTPMTDADAKPFAGLAGLKDKLENPD